MAPRTRFIVKKNRALKRRFLTRSKEHYTLRKIKVIQIGIGHDHATSALNSLLRQPDIFEVLGFAVPESEEEKYPERIAEYTDGGLLKKYSVDELLALPGVEAAVIETEELVLTKYALMAAERGLHVHMDKPGGADLAEFERLANTLKERSLALSLGYMYRFNPKVIEAFKKIGNGDIGEVYCVEAHMDCEHGVGKRQWLSDFPGGMMFYLGCHLVDLVYRLQGEPDEVIPLSCSTGFDGVTADDYGMVVFRYPRGISFAKTCDNERGGFIRRQLVICGSKGTIEIKPFEILTDERDMLYTVMRETYPGEGWNSFGRETKSERFNRFDDMMRNFAEVATGDKVNPYSYDYELGLYKLILRACGKNIDEVLS
mgnify:CR=1 FL=1